MIGQWDNNNCVFALAPNAWSKGNGDSDKNTGNMPSYPNGDYQNCVLTNMGTGYGYVYNSEDGYLRFDGVDDYIQTQYPVSLNGDSTNLTIEIKADSIIGSTRYLFGLQDDSSNLIYSILTDDGRLRLVTRANGVYAQSWGDTTRGSGEYTFTFRIVNGVIKLYIDGIEETSYGLQQTITQTKTFTNKLKLCSYVGTAPFLEKIYWFAIYEEAISEARILTNHNLDNSLCLKGINTVDTMELKIIGCNILRFRRQIM